MPVQKTCEAPNCGGKVLARGLCAKHYRRRERTGKDPRKVADPEPQDVEHLKRMLASQSGPGVIDGAEEAFARNEAKVERARAVWQEHRDEIIAAADYRPCFGERFFEGAKPRRKKPRPRWQEGESKDSPGRADQRSEADASTASAEVSVRERSFSVASAIPAREASSGIQTPDPPREAGKSQMGASPDPSETDAAGRRVADESEIRPSQQEPEPCPHCGQVHDGGPIQVVARRDMFGYPEETFETSCPLVAAQSDERIWKRLR